MDNEPTKQELIETIASLTGALMALNNSVDSNIPSMALSLNSDVIAYINNLSKE